MNGRRKILGAALISSAAVLLLGTAAVMLGTFLNIKYEGPEAEPFDTFGEDSEIYAEKAADTLAEIPETTTEPETESETESETEAVTWAQQTEGTTAEPLPVISTSERVIDALGEDTVSYLMSLDNTPRGWGQGVNVDEKNRPQGALWAQNQYGAYGSKYIMEDASNMYLTFDEGYENGYTPLILDTLRDKGVSAVFFVTLSYAKSNPDLIWRMINEGHIVGNHSAYHGSLPNESLEDAYDEVKILHDYIYENFGYTMSLFRFPQGESSDRTQALLSEMGYTSLFWSYAYRDWETANQPDPASSLDKLTNIAHPGALILLHAVSSTNTEILPALIDNYRSMGYTLAPFPVN